MATDAENFKDKDVHKTNYPVLPAFLIKRAANFLDKMEDNDYYVRFESNSESIIFLNSEEHEITRIDYHLKGQHLRTADKVIEFAKDRAIKAFPTENGIYDGFQRLVTYYSECSKVGLFVNIGYTGFLTDREIEIELQRIGLDAD